MQIQNTNLTIKYLINLLNDHTDLKIDKKKYFIDSYPVLKIGNIISYDNLLTALLFSCKNIQHEISNQTLEISINPHIIKSYKLKIDEFIRNSSIDQSKQKKYINYIHNITNNQTIQIPPNDSILVLSYYFGINLIIYNTDSQIVKCYYYDDKLDRELPFILIKETKNNDSPNLYYELVFSQNKYIFDYSHPIIIELLPNAFIVGLEHNKKLEYVEIQKVSDVLNITDDFEKIDMEKTIKLKLIPNKILRLIDELNTTNFTPFRL
jgi:hypothetical protein